MVLRTSKRGQNQGEQFWGCSGYPKCRGIIPVEVIVPAEDAGPVPTEQAIAARPAAESPTDAPVCPKCGRSEEHTSELQSLMRISYAVFCLKKKNTTL